MTLLLGGSGLPVEAQQSDPGRPEVLILGTFHMANPGRDVFNLRTDDVLSPERQNQIAELVRTLARFKPTKIAVESSFSSDAITKRYAGYLEGSYELTRNEAEQIGFRLAKELGHETIYPVDVDGEFPYPRLVKFMTATGRLAEFETLQARTAERVKLVGTFMSNHTILETLLLMNSDEQVADGVDAYLQMAAFGEGWDWAGADLVSDWFRRNMRIYTNIANLADSPGERILVIYGAGHAGWLQFGFENNSNFRLRKLRELVEQP